MSSVGNLGPYARAAALWRRAGWQGVLPVNGKDLNLPAGFTGHRGNWPSLDNINAWVETRGQSNIIIRLPLNVIGIDVDAYHDGTRQRVGAETIASWEAEYGTLPQTYVSSARPRSTGSGIYLFQVPTDVDWISDLGKESDVQIIRYAHRYMVTWPSIHPATGEMYCLYGPDNAVSANGTLPEGLIKLPRPDDLPMLSPAWVEGLTRRPHGALQLAQDVAEDAVSSYQGAARRAAGGAPAVTSAPESSSLVDPELMLFLGAPPGEQNNRLFSYVCSLHARKIAREEMIILAGTAVSRMQNSDPSNPWTPDDVISMVDRVIKTYTPGTTYERSLTISDSQRSFANSFKESSAGENLAVSNGSHSSRDNNSTRDDIYSDTRDTDQVSDTTVDLDVSVRLPDAPESREFPTSNASILDTPRQRLTVGSYPTIPTLSNPMIGGAYANIESLEDLTDAGNAQRFARIYKDVFRYVPEWKQWIYWHDNRRWKIDIDNTKVLHATLAIADDIRATDGDRANDEMTRDRYRQWMQHSRSTKARNEILKVARALPEMQLSANALDNNPFLLAFENCVVELLSEVDPETHQAWRIREPRPDDYLSLNTNVWFDPTATSSVWDTYLKFVQPVYETRAYIQALEGYGLQRGNPKRIWAILRGEPTTGKTTFSECIATALGDYCASSDHGIFMEVKGSRPRPDILNVLKRRRVMVPETNKSIILDASIVKRVTGNTRISVRGNFSNTFTNDTPDCFIVMDCNQLPIIKGADDAIRERTIIIPFNHKMNRIKSKEKSDRIEECWLQLSKLSTPKEAITTIQREDPQQTLSAIMHWLLDGWTLYRMGALENFANRAPSEVLTETTSAHDELDMLNDYYNDMCEKGASKAEPISRLYAAYSLWTKDNGIKDKMTKQTFGSYLKVSGFKSEERKWYVTGQGKRKQATIYHGLCLTDDARDSILAYEWVKGVDI